MNQLMKVVAVFQKQVLSSEACTDRSCLLVGACGWRLRTWLMMPGVRDMMTAHWVLAVAMHVTKKPSRHFFLIHS